MKCVVLQPSYIPWRGYFHQIQKADLFVFYDCVQYDHHGWRNRNKIKSNGGTQWLTIPVSSKGARSNGIPISEIPIVWDTDWRRKHRSTIAQNYGNSPFFSRYQDLLDDIYSRKDRLLADLTCETTELLARELGINDTKFIRSSTLPTTGNKSQRLLSLLTQLGATHYISGPSASGYLDLDAFSETGITVEFMSYDYPEYEQLFEPFAPDVSILDLLFNVGSDAAGHIWRGT